MQIFKSLDHWFHSAKWIMALALYGSCCIAHAATTTSSITFRAIYNTSCSVGVVSDWDFGYIGAGASTTPNVAVSQQLKVVCTNGQNYGLWIPFSSNVSGSQRRMLNTESAANYLNYNLTFSGGAAVPSSSTTSGYTGTGATQYVSITATVPAGQTLSAGTYVDNIVVTLSF